MTELVWLTIARELQALSQTSTCAAPRSSTAVCCPGAGRM
jgi:hypothetical protein